MGLFKPVVFFKQKVVAGGIPIQPEATAFLTATGITDPTISSAVNELVYDLKNAGVWSNMVAIYPFVGGTATTHKYNLVNPVDTDAGFRLSFNGVSHSSNGITNGGGSNNGAFTHIKLITNIVQNDNYGSVYVRNNTSVGHDYGAISGGNGMQLASNNGGNFNTKAMDNVNADIANSDSRGFYQASRIVSTEYYKQKNTTRNTVTQTSVTPPASEWIGIGLIATAEVNAGVQPSNKNYAYAAFGAGLTTTEMDDHYTAVQKFQTTLGRQV